MYIQKMQCMLYNISVLVHTDAKSLNSVLFNKNLLEAMWTQLINYAITSCYYLTVKLSSANRYFQLKINSH